MTTLTQTTGESDESLATQRTHRYLRLSLGGTVVVILVAVALAIPVVGWLPSISHYYYSPARTAFVGALIAASVALFALSGRRAERALLDVAALFAPLIALIPAPVTAGGVADVTVDCAGACIPDGLKADVANGIATYVIVTAIGVVIAFVLLRRGVVGGPGVRFSLILAVVIIAAVAVVALVWPEVLLTWAHVVATVIFFVLIAWVAALNALRQTTTAMPSTGLRIAYLIIATVMIVDLIGLAWAMVAGFYTDLGDFPWVLIGEASALVAFLVFWLLQTVQRWNEGDPVSLTPDSPWLAW